MERITAKRLQSLRKPGRYRADQTLYLILEPSGSRHWVQRIVVGGRRRDLGLGSYPLTSLAEARERAYENRQRARQGGDPLPRVPTAPTLRQAASKVEQGTHWRGRTRENRRAALETYAAGLLDRGVDRIGREEVLRILVPLYHDKPATGRRLRGWIRGVLAWAQAHGHIEANVCGEMIDAALPSAPKVKEHREALPYAQVPAALAAVAASTASASTRACLRFIALTGVRSGEARGAKWSELDLDERTWTIPAARMKTGVSHRVPLPEAAVRILESMRALRGASDLVFPSAQGKALSPSTLVKALRAIGYSATVHGFRTSFRTWAAEKADTTRDIAEMCLAHVVGSDIERSYSRTDLFDKRRLLMDQWAAWCLGLHAS